MTVKQTDRAKIQGFGQLGIEIFNEIEGLLNSLVTETAGVAYRGANAFAFKTKCTNNAVDFGNNCSTSMQQIATAISEQTSIIAQNLGGAPIELQPPTVTITAPAIDADTSVESADSGPLRSLSDSVKTTCDQVKGLFEENLANLQSLGTDGWVGPEYDDALKQVTTITESVVENVESTKTVMVGDITDQLDALGM
jgi:hypothetical protein